MPPVILETNLPGIPLLARGKVRDVYAMDAETLLFVATDRISAFDYVLASGIPDKGRVLTQLSIFWFDFLRDLTPNHIITSDFREYPISLRPYEDQLLGRSMLVRRARMVDVECVARGYLCGSGWKDYQATQAVCGIALPEGLLDGSRLPEPIFTPATKAQSGHDENISFDTVTEGIGLDLAHELRRRTLAIYDKASDHAASKGIILADTKFEFGFVDGELILGDEVLTPDSSRFWPRETWKPGGAQISYDKQFVRNYLERIEWNKQPPAPGLPEEIALETSRKYVEAYRLLAGKELWEQTAAGAWPAGGDRARNIAEIRRGLSFARGERTMNWLDLVLAAIFGLSIASGFWKGFFRLSIGLAATVLSILLASWFYGLAASVYAPYLKERSLANLLGFLTILIGVQLTGALLSKLLAKLFKSAGLGWLDRLLGGAFGFVRALLVCAVFVMVLTAFTWTPSPGAVSESRLAPYVMESARILVYLTPREIRDGFAKNYEKIREQWNHTLTDTIKKAPVFNQ